MTRTVLALDINATKAGVALPTGRLLTITAPDLRTRDRRNAVGIRLAWWDAHLGDLLRFYGPDIVAVEDYAAHAPGMTGKLRGAEVAGIPRRIAILIGATLVDDVKPNTLTKWATGSGRADKDGMIAAAITRGHHPANDDEADAALLRDYVLETLDQRPAEAGRRWLLT
jgi:Holliday junction resolvasome RuvABC endonuclease subunit